MTTHKKDQDTKNQDNQDNHEKGKQGFASMPKEKVREIAAEGGRHSHGSSSTQKK